MSENTAITVRIALRHYRRYCLGMWLQTFTDEYARIDFAQKADLETWANEIRQVNDAAKELRPTQ